MFIIIWSLVLKQCFSSFIGLYIFCWPERITKTHVLICHLKRLKNVHIMCIWMLAVLMSAGQVRGPRWSLTEPAKKILGFTQNKNQIRVDRKYEQDLLKIQRVQMETEHPGDSEMKKTREPPLCFRSGVFTEAVVWCTCPLRHPGTIRNKDKGPGVLHKSLTLWGQGISTLRCPALRGWNTHRTASSAHSCPVLS